MTTVPAKVERSVNTLNFAINPRAGSLSGIDLAEFPGSGETQALMRSMDWTRSPLGVPSSWPPTLQHVVNTYLSCRIGVTIWWGPELCLIYNDAYLPILGPRHPASLGQPAEKVWADVWPIIGPQIESVLNGGEPTLDFKACVPLMREGRMQDAWFTYSYSPMYDELGNIPGVISFAIEETNQVIAERDRDRSATQRQLALDAACMGWWHYDPVNQLATLDDRFRALFGFEHTVVPNAEVLKHIHPEDLPRVWSCVEAALNPDNPAPYASTYRIVRPDGETRWIEAHGTATFEETGTDRIATGLVGTISDITERQLLSEQREKALELERDARAESDRVSRLKDEFLATLSHELRTPLSTVLGWSQILRAGTDDPALVGQAVDVIERTARVQVQLIEDLLDVSKIVSGKVLLQVEPLSPHAILEAALQNAGPSAESKNIRLQSNPDGRRIGCLGRSEPVAASPVEHPVECREIHVERWRHFCRAWSAWNLTSKYEFLIQGTGLKRNFFRMYSSGLGKRMPPSHVKKGGLGFGLSIVKSLVELHGGTVAVQSAGKGRGATFTVSLPIQSVSIAMGEIEAQRSGEWEGLSADFVPADLDGMSVLVIDDESDALLLLERVLGSCKARVISVSSAEAAIKVVKTEQLDIIISDIGMPDVYGYELIRQVRSEGHKHNHSVPAIALTAFARPEDKQRAIKAGFTAHMAKPVLPSELVTEIVNLTRRAIRRE